MTEPNEPTTPPEPVDDVVDEPLTLAEARKLRRESAGLRRRLHDAEEQIGAEAARETAHQRAEVERIAAEHLVDASDIWRAQPDLSAYCDEEFHEITRDRVVETAKALAAEKPHLARPQQISPPPTSRPIEGLKSGAMPDEKPAPVGWSAVIRGG